jgi:hypothetical protein
VTGTFLQGQVALHADAGRDPAPDTVRAELPGEQVVGEGDLEDLLEAQLEVRVLDGVRASTRRSRLRGIQSPEPIR